MNLFQQPRPRRFNHKYIYVDERKERLQKRNEKVRQLFEELSAKHPQWKVDALVEEVANIMFLSPRTIVAILSFQGGYAER